MNITEYALRRKMSGGGAPSGKVSWNNITDRPFGTTIEEVTVTHDAEFGETELIGFPPFKVGDTVSIKVDDVTHSLVAYEVDGFPVIGDDPYSIFESEGESVLGWGVAYFDEGGWTSFMATESNHTVVYEGEVTHQIDVKYLPYSHQFGDEEYVITDVTFTGDEEYNRIDLDELYIEKGQMYLLEVDGDRYEVKCTEEFGSGHAIIDFRGEDYGVDFNVQANRASGGSPFITCSIPAHVVIKGIETVQISEEYIPRQNIVEGDLHIDLTPMKITVPQIKIDTNTGTDKLIFVRAHYEDGRDVLDYSSILRNKLNNTRVPVYVFEESSGTRIGEIVYNDFTKVRGVFYCKENNKTYIEATLNSA